MVYTHNAINSGACAVRNQAIMQAKGQYLTGIDDDDESTPNRLSIFLSHKTQLAPTRFCMPMTMFARARSEPAAGQPAAVSEITVFPPPVLQAQHYRQSGVYLAWRFKECLFDTELKAAQDYDTFLRMVVEYGEPWKVEEATQILHINHGEMQITSSSKKFSGYFHFYRTRTSLTVPAGSISSSPCIRSGTAHELAHVADAAVGT